MKWIAALCLSALSAAAQMAPYMVKVETGPGLVAITFTVQQNQARAYLPDDLAPGEMFSGAMEGQRNYILEFAGQRTRVGDGIFRWRVPAEARAGEFLPLILRDVRGAELARANVPVLAPRPLPASFRFPRQVEAGSTAPVAGPFDGDARSTSVTIGGENAEVLAESLRKAIVRAPEKLSGPLPYTFKKGDVERQGMVRSLLIDTKTPPNAIDVAVSGLQGLQEDIPIQLGGDYIFIRPASVREDGTYRATINLFAFEPEATGTVARIIFPQTPRDDVGLILHTPRRDRSKDAALEHAEALHRLEFDAIPVLQEFLNDYDLSSDAAYAMLATDEARAMPVLLRSMPASGGNVERIGLGWFLSHWGTPEYQRSAVEARAAALRVLATPSSGTDAIELALHTLGLSGNMADFPLLQTHYRYRSGWSGLQRIQDASEAALARLGSREHLESIRVQLAAPFPEHATPPQAVRVGQVLQKAGFAGDVDLIPSVCPHLNDPAVVDIDVTWDPKISAIIALSSIVDKTSPLAATRRKSVEEWKVYCQAVR